MSTSDKGGFRRQERRDQPLLNERIRDRELRVIDEDGGQVGIVTRQEALQIARDKGLDLLVVQPDAAPPVAKIVDFHRYEFENKKRDKENKKKHHIVDVKEIKMRYKIEEHDYQVKLRSGHKFLNDGDKIKVNMMLRGREMQHKHLAMDLLRRFAEDLKDLGIVDKEPRQEGKSVIMIISPIPQKGKPALVERDDTESDHMPKMKTNKAAARRFKITGTGKILRRQAGKRHLNEWKSANHKSKLRGWAAVPKDQEQNVRELFPYPQYIS